MTRHDVPDALRNIMTHYIAVLQHFGTHMMRFGVYRNVPDTVRHVVIASLDIRATFWNIYMTPHMGLLQQYGTYITHSDTFLELP